MTLLHPRAEPTHVDEPDAEALIREARRLRRRRQLISTVAIAVLVGAGVWIGLAATGGGAGRPTVPPLPAIGGTPSAARPTVDASAFAGQGNLAFVSLDDLWVLDGTTKSLRQVAVPRGYQPSSPMFSPDHRWLAYVATPPSPTQSPELCVAKADGSDAHLLARLPAGGEEPQVFGWNPRKDVIAYEKATPEGVGVVPVNGNSFEKYRYSVWTWSPGSKPKEVTSAAEITLAAWSPDGAQLAVGADTGAFAATFGHGGFTATITSYSLDGRHPTVWLHKYFPKGDSNYEFLVPVGWWEQWGIGFYELGSAYGAFNASAWNSGLGVSVISRPGGTPKNLSVSVLYNGATTPINVSSRTGQLALSSNSALFARPIWANEAVDLCTPQTGKCARITIPSGKISMNAMWSPDGTKLAYAVGNVISPEQSIGSVSVQGWYDSFQLRILNTRTGTTSVIDQLQGSAIPLWSPNSEGLLVERDDAIWLWSGTGRPVEIVGTLNAPASFYGQVDWSDQFAWSQSSAQFAL